MKTQVKVITKQDQNVLENIFRLRYSVYVIEKGWAPDAGNLMEQDNYDEQAGYIAVLQKGEVPGVAEEVIATARFISLQNKIMLDEEFHELVAGVDLIREGAIEITRIAIDNRFRHQHLDIQIYQKLVQWSIENNIQYWYFVVEKKYLRYLNRLGIKAVRIGKAKTFPDGVTAIAAYIDLKWVLEVLQSENNQLYLKVVA